MKLADFTAYFEWLETEVKRHGNRPIYIPLACTKAEFDPVTGQRIGEAATMA